MVFKAGDRVNYINDRYISMVDRGETGTVLFVSEGDLAHVRWDNFVEGRHTCSGACDDGHGWNVRFKNLDLATPADLGEICGLSQLSLSQLLD